MRYVYYNALSRYEKVNTRTDEVESSLAGLNLPSGSKRERRYVSDYLHVFVFRITEKLLGQQGSPSHEKTA